MSKSTKTPAAEISPAPVAPAPVAPPVADPPEATAKDTAPSAPVPTPEELAERANEFIESMFPDPRKKKAAPKPDKPETPAPLAEEKPPEEKEEAPPEKKVETKLPPPIGEAVKETDLPAPLAPAPKAEIVTDDLSDKDRVTLAALAHMEQSGSAPKGMVARTKAFWTAEADYIAGWRKENKGTEFDPADPQHVEFYEKNEPNYDEESFDNARIEVITERKVAARSKQDDEKRAKEDSQRRRQEAEPRIANSVQESMTKLVAEAGYEDLMKDKDGKLSLTSTVAKAISDENPAALAVLLDETDILAAQIAEIEKFATLDGYQHDEKMTVPLKSGLKIAPHAMIQELTMDLEKEIAALPPEQTVRAGKRFSTHGDFTSAVDRILGSKADNAAKGKAFDKLNREYYTIDWDDVKTAVIVKHTERAKARIGTRSKISPKETAPKKEEPAQPKIPDFDTGAAPRNAPPSISSSTDNVDTQRRNTGKGEKTADEVVKSMW